MRRKPSLKDTLGKKTPGGRALEGEEAEHRTEEFFEIVDRFAAKMKKGRLLTARDGILGPEDKG